MRTKTIIGLIFASALALTPAAHANTIVDTGPSTSDTAARLYAGQWLAAEFVTTQPWIITSIEGWIRPTIEGNVTFALYSDGGDIPGMNLFSQVLNIASANDPAWYGPSGLNWPLLAAGSYWAAFEVRDGSSFQGAMPGPSDNPLINEAFTSNMGLLWTPLDSLDIGVRIKATDVATVPESNSSILLLSIALFGMLIAAVVSRPVK